MATQSYIVNSLYLRGWQPSISKSSTFSFPETSKYPTKRSINGSTSRTLQCCSCYKEIFEATAATTALNTLDSKAVLNCVKLNHVPSDFMMRLVLADLDPATAKIAIGFLGPFLSAFGFLFILRIVMSWYPKLPVGKFPYVIAYAPTEPFLIATRKVIPPLAGVDVTPVVWFGLLSFLNEILVGPQGLLVLLSQQVN
ncbi:Protein COFACTOR ASSEMBLY OF COMPLEX C SUBUNIT B ccb3, chloroplastic [Stylosanthes scabra]|uniref:Protein COFACTOR ASSEMBLY OF COMPLEX C SUBUNIT B ccb3, chloroplastic n=1 Tax=Stylosanthes scabra TaxID=79078 RepID=A0ABU6RER9_9FABA|nr:Protein COFACTOR ASSEMBLY OF COMPLEX C SUBUNIT B ccb3, chloroplastic [Stylosanthes scabra]